MDGEAEAPRITCLDFRARSPQSWDSLPFWNPNTLVCLRIPDPAWEETRVEMATWWSELGKHWPDLTRVLG